MNPRLERAIEAYRDGGLSPRKRRKLERVLDANAEARSYLRSGDALGRIVREAWTEGPTCPPAERFLAAIRPELQRVDAERARALRSRRADPFHWLRPIPFGLGAAAAAAAVLVVAAFQLGGRGEDTALARALPIAGPRVLAQALPPESSALAMPVSEMASSAFGSGPSAKSGESRPAIYDLYQGDAALLVYDGQDESPLLIFALPDEGDDVSLAPGSSGGWA